MWLTEVCISVRDGACRSRLRWRDAATSPSTAFFDARWSQTTSDFFRHDALMERLADDVIQALQKRGDAFLVAAHECGDQSLVVYGDGRTFYWRHSDAPPILSSARL
jgi:hypothetical protein